jgi:GlpG protein
MRIIGHLQEESPARIFGDYLLVQGMENQVEHDTADAAGPWSVWVMDEDRLGEASRLLEEFRRNPNDPRYQKEAHGAASIRASKEQEQEAYRKKMISRRHLFRPVTGYGFGRLTFSLIAISALVFLISKGGRDSESIRWLFISEYVSGPGPFSEVLKGQVWRLFTPIFIHYGIMHVFFNMLWLRDLGSMIEARQSTAKLALLVAVLAIISNSLQYLTSGPSFGGMSGVVYGLLGYIWIRGRYDPASGLFVQQSTVVMMLIWFFACFTGLLGSVANMAHLGGLVAGCAWGYIASQRYR